MPVVRKPISRSQLAELFGCEPKDFVAIDRTLTGWELVTEPDEDEMQTTGTCPPLSDNTSKRKPRKGTK